MMKNLAFPTFSPRMSLSDLSSGQVLAMWTISEPVPCSSSSSRVRLRSLEPMAPSRSLALLKRIVTRSSSVRCGISSRLRHAVVVSSSEKMVFWQSLGGKRHV